MAKISSEYWEKKTNGWVFLSHSSHDYEETKIVRNYLEENNFNALMFYLKCFDDKGKSIEVQDLIECEIRSRNIFVLCNSKEALLSSWVKKEVSYVKSFPDKIFKEIDIDELKYKKCTQLSILDDLMNLSTIFFSYSSKDKVFVDKTYRFLSTKGFKIFYDTIKMRKSKNIKDAIEEVVNKGTVLLFLSNKSVKTAWFRNNLTNLLNTDVIIPIFIDKIDNNNDLNELKINNIQDIFDKDSVNMSKGTFDENMEKLLHFLKKRLNK